MRPLDGDVTDGSGYENPCGRPIPPSWRDRDLGCERSYDETPRYVRLGQVPIPSELRDEEGGEP